MLVEGGGGMELKNKHPTTQCGEKCLAKIETEMHVYVGK